MSYLKHTARNTAVAIFFLLLVALIINDSFYTGIYLAVLLIAYADITLMLDRAGI